jgi:superoxide dismutase
MQASCEVDLKHLASKDFLPVFSEKSLKMHLDIIHLKYIEEVRKKCQVGHTFLTKRVSFL